VTSTIEERVALLEERVGQPIPLEERLARVEAQLERPRRKDIWDILQALSPLLTAILVGFIGYMLKDSISLAIEQRKLDLQRYQASATYTQILAEKDTPPYVKALGLAAMYRFGLADLDFLFDVGYELENREESATLKPLLYASASGSELVHLPIGSLTFHPASAGGGYDVTGWALDDGHVTRIEVSVDGTKLLDVANYGTLREDIGELFPRYASAWNSGFGFTLPRDLVHAGTHRIAVRLWDDKSHFRDICDRLMAFRGSTVEFTPQTPHTRAQREGSDRVHGPGQ
jgi:hypothetical protein